MNLTHEENDPFTNNSIRSGDNRRFASQTFYDILGVDVAASKVKIREAFIRLKKTYGASNQALYSIMDEEGARKMLGEIEEAFRTLDDEKLRRKYDEKIGIAPRASERSLSPSHLGQEATDPLPEGGFITDDTLLDSTGGENSGLVTSIMHKTYTPVKRVPEAGVSDEMKEKLAQLMTDNDLGDGALYRQIRESMNISLREVHNYTRVMENYLLAIEENNYGKLPQPVYTRGFIKSYLQYLGISQPDPFVTRYMEHFTHWAKKPLK